MEQPTTLELAGNACAQRRQDLINRVRHLTALGMMNDFSQDPLLPSDMVDELMHAALIFKKKITTIEERDEQPAAPTPDI